MSGNRKRDNPLTTLLTAVEKVTFVRNAARTRMSLPNISSQLRC